MARGTIAGVIWGTIAVAVGAGGLSIALGPPAPPGPKLQEPAPVEEAAVAAEDKEGPVEPARDAAAAPDVKAAAPEAPAAGQADADSQDLAAAITPPAVDAARDAGQATPGLASLDAPDAPADAVAAVTQPKIGAVPDALGEAVPAPEDAAAEIGGASDAPPAAPEAVAPPGAPDAEAAPEAPQDPVARPEVPAAPTQAEAIAGVGEALAPPAPDQPVLAEPAPGQAALDVPAADAAPDLDIVPAEPPARDDTDDTTVTMAAPAVEGRPSIGEPAGSLIDRDGAVTQSRLPRIGADDAEDAAPAVAVVADSPLLRFAAPSDAAPGVPRLSVVLIDDGSGPLGPDALRSFPFPLSFAITPGHPDPVAATDGYRRNGFEVMVLASLPDGAQASDVEVALQAALDRVPEAMGVIEAPEGGLQQNRETATQVAAYLAETGHGLVMQPKGLNTGQQLALRAGVPSAAVFRDLDGEGQDPSMIRRVLDMAALRAGQEGAVVMLGRLRADTVSALVQWGLQDRASAVALVPASVVLRESLDR